MNREEARAKLIAELAAGGVTDARVLAAIESVPREAFMPKLFKDRAWENLALPIGHHQTISQPLVVALMTQALDVGDRMKVLEVGTGSGYQAAILARLCRRLYSVERHPPLLREAEARLAELRIHNVTVQVADGMKGWTAQAPFDRIMVTAAAADIPERLVAQLEEGGIMVFPLGDHEKEQQIVRLFRTGTGYRTETLNAVRFVPLLPGVAAAELVEDG